MMNVMPSVIRTGVPIIVGIAVSFAATKGIHVSAETETQLAVLVGGAAAALYHWLVRLFEERWPRAGWLLGLARAPRYDNNDSLAWTSSTKYDEDGNITEIVTVYRPHQRQE